MSKFLYINNLGQSVDLSELETLFTRVGDVESVRLEVLPETGRTLGIVEMRTEQQALDCIERFHGHIMQGQSLWVTSNKPKFMYRKVKTICPLN